MKPLTSIVKYYASFYDSNGHMIGKKRIDPTEKVFSYKKRSFNFDSDVSSCLRLNGYVFYKRFYFYDYDHPEPLNFKKDKDSVLTSEQLEVMINTKVLRDLNNLSKDNWLLALLTPLNIIILVVVGFLFWYLKSRNFKLW